jgi:hypothetical protein
MAAYLTGALVLALMGGVVLGAAAFERHMSSAEENLATLQYEAAAAELDAAASYAGYAKWVPGTGRTAERDLRHRRASLQYWQRQYAQLLPREADPVGAVESEDVALQLLVANGAYRVGQTRGGASRETAVQALDEAMAGYLTVLKSETWDESAAYNFEYVVRLRDDLSSGRMKTLPPPESENASHGSSGAQMKTAEMDRFEIFVPLESEERSEAAEAGKAAPNKRKG